jgi:hypothetical protein
MQDLYGQDNEASFFWVYGEDTMTCCKLCLRVSRRADVFFLCLPDTAGTPRRASKKGWYRELSLSLRRELFFLPRRRRHGRQRFVNGGSSTAVRQQRHIDNSSRRQVAKQGELNDAT